MLSLPWGLCCLPVSPLHPFPLEKTAQLADITRYTLQLSLAIMLRKLIMHLKKEKAETGRLGIHLSKKSLSRAKPWVPFLAANSQGIMVTPVIQF